jgi:hypothetical protein
VPSRWSNGEGHVGIEVLEHIDVGLPGVGEDGMPGRNVQRKLGTTRGSPRRSRTAKASRISRLAAKSRCACEWVGWGRLSGDGPGHYNPDSSDICPVPVRPHLTPHLESKRSIEAKFFIGRNQEVSERTLSEKIGAAQCG